MRTSNYRGTVEEKRLKEACSKRHVASRPLFGNLPIPLLALHIYVTISPSLQQPPLSSVNANFDVNTSIRDTLYLLIGFRVTSSHLGGNDWPAELQLVRHPTATHHSAHQRRYHVQRPRTTCTQQFRTYPGI
jgi:hypothetical protein